MELTDWLPSPFFMTSVLLALLAKYILYFGFRKLSECSEHADQNMKASLTIAVMNIFAMVWFLDDINKFMARMYDALHIPTLSADTWDNVPLPLVIIIGMLARDFADYWNHRLMHTRWLWPTHATHHSDTHVNAFTGMRVHFLESFMMQLTSVVMLTWLQMPEAIPFVIAFNLIHGLYTHLDLDWDHGPFKYIIASPRFHRWHHADVPEAYGKNLAIVFPFYDVVFGTYYNPGSVDGVEMGALRSGVPDKNPFHIYVYPFLLWGRMFRAVWRDKSQQENDSQPRREAREPVDHMTL